MFGVLDVRHFKLHVDLWQLQGLYLEVHGTQSKVITGW